MLVVTGLEEGFANMSQSNKVNFRNYICSPKQHTSKKIVLEEGKNIIEPKRVTNMHSSS